MVEVGVVAQYIAFLACMGPRRHDDRNDEASQAAAVPWPIRIARLVKKAQQC